APVRAHPPILQRPVLRPGGPLPALLHRARRARRRGALTRRSGFIHSRPSRRRAPIPSHTAPASASARRTWINRSGFDGLSAVRPVCTTSTVQVGFGLWASCGKTMARRCGLFLLTSQASAEILAAPTDPGGTDLA